MAAVRRRGAGQNHRQLLCRDWHCAAAFAMNDGNRRAPVALAGNAPVAQPPRDVRFAEALLFRMSDDRLFRLCGRQAVEWAGSVEHAVALPGSLHAFRD